MNPRRAFTLIELLVVIAVIALLTALIMPAVARAKTSAYQIKCASNLRQLALAGHMYWDDHSGQAFRWRSAATNNGSIYWFGWIENGAEGERRFDPTLGALYPYLSSRGVKVCPAFKYSGTHLKLKATGASFGYGYNLELSAPINQPEVNMARVAFPAQVVFLADAAQVNTFQPPASPDNPMLEEFYYVSTNEPTVHFRHQHRANAAFCDGHVATEKPMKGSLDTRLPRQTIGRLRLDVLRLD